MWGVLMGRHRTFSEQTVLDGAMHAFRRRGYRGASVRDLEDATGLKMGSIYNSFGDKAGLFDAAFKHYNQEVLQRRIDEHAPPSAGLRGLRALFLTLLLEPGGGSHGCLITSAAVEFGGEGESHPGVEDAFRTLTRTFLDRLTAAAAGGDLRPEIDPLAQSVKLLALYQGILVLVRAGHPPAAIENAVHSEFDVMEAGRGH